MNSMKSSQVEVKEFSTTISSRKGLDGCAVVRFDSECSLCRMLADFMGQRVSSDDIIFEPSTAAVVRHLQVEVFKDQQSILLVDSEAWSWLLQEHPTLKELNWVAQKLGIHSATALTLQRSAEFLRKFCLRCRR